MEAPLPPRRPPQAEINQLAQTQAAPASPVRQEGPIDMLGGLGDGVMEFLQSLFGQAFGGQQNQYPGYKWDGFEGWVPDGSAPAAPASKTPMAPNTPAPPAAVSPDMLNPKPMGPASTFK